MLGLVGLKRPSIELDEMSREKFKGRLILCPLKYRIG
jgi:hypothetical protein